MRFPIQVAIMQTEILSGGRLKIILNPGEVPQLFREETLGEMLPPGPSIDQRVKEGSIRPIGQCGGERFFMSTEVKKLSRPHRVIPGVGAIETAVVDKSQIETR